MAKCEGQGALTAMESAPYVARFASNRARYMLPADKPQIPTPPSQDESTTVRKAYRTECPVQTEGSQNVINARQALTFSITGRHYSTPWSSS